MTLRIPLGAYVNLPLCKNRPSPSEAILLKAVCLGPKKIKLANAWDDPTLMKQIIASNQYRKYLPTGESNLIKLYAQGNYVGLYVNDESINKQFLEKHFGEKDGPLFKCDNITR